MFDVPGWSVPSSSLKTQIKSSPKKLPAKSNFIGKSTVSRFQALKKRKRARGQSNNSNVSIDDLPDLWEKVIQGNAMNPASEAVRSPKRKKTGSKKEKNDPEHNLVVEDIRSEPSHGDTHPPLPNRNLLEEVCERAVMPAGSKQQPRGTNLTRLQASMQQKLTSARFRHLNQTLYTTPSSEALRLFRQDPEMFEDYHDGFRRQVEIWPENPVDGYIRALKERGKSRKGSWIRYAKGETQNPTMGEDKRSRDLAQLPRTEGMCTVADLGCGDAKLARAMEDVKKKLKIKVLSFDLHSSSTFVTPSDIAQLPLKDRSVDVAIFCLSLMGTNWIDFVEEAWRVLRWKGELWLAEIKSRFGRVGKRGTANNVSSKKRPLSPAKGRDAGDEDHEPAGEVDGHSDGRHETDVSALVDVFHKRGFILQDSGAVDTSNKMFVKLNFVKALMPVKGKGVPARKGGTGEETWRKRKFLDNNQVDDIESAVLKPCVYKIR